MLCSRTPYSRAISILLVLFSLLSSGRTLVPGMCATLSAMQDARRGDCTTSTCCSADLSAATEPGVTHLRVPKKHVGCAFCNLAKGTIPLEAGAVLDVPESTVTRAAISQIERPELTARWNYSRPRDPPFGSLPSPFFV